MLLLVKIANLSRFAFSSYSVRIGKIRLADGSIIQYQPVGWNRMSKKWYFIISCDIIKLSERYIAMKEAL